MNLNKKELATIIFATIVLTATVTYGFLKAPEFVRHRDPQTNANVYIRVYQNSGIYDYQSGNIITDWGENLVRDALGFANATTANATKYISLGNSTIAATKTALDTEATTNGFARALGTVVHWYNTTGTDRAYNVTYFFSATAGSTTLGATGLQTSPTSGGDPAGGSLFALASFTQTTFVYTDATHFDNCSITWVITIDAN